MSALIRYESPVGMLSNWIDDFFRGAAFETTDRQFTTGSWPRVDIVEEENEYAIKADIPGIDKKDIKITVENGVLCIEGEKKTEHREEKGSYRHLERNYGKFSRSFMLPDAVDAGKIEAKLTNGVLELHLPKSERARPKAIEVKVE